MPKVSGHGQAAIITESEYLKIRRVLEGWHKIFWDIAYYTGERWGAIVALQVEDVFFGGKPLKYITFRAATRKGDTRGHRETRQIPIAPVLMEKLKAYSPPTSGWLFPSQYGDKEGHVSFKTADAFLRAALEKLGYQDRGISTHSTRRSLITRLNERGVDIKLIQAITGHKDLDSLSRYIEVSPERIIQAMACA